MDGCSIWPQAAWPRIGRNGATRYVVARGWRGRLQCRRISPDRASRASHATTKNGPRRPWRSEQTKVHQGETGAKLIRGNRLYRDRAATGNAKGRANAGACLGYQQTLTPHHARRYRPTASWNALARRGRCAPRPAAGSGVNRRDAPARERSVVTFTRAYPAGACGVCSFFPERRLGLEVVIIKTRRPEKLWPGGQAGHRDQHDLVQGMQQTDAMYRGHQNIRAPKGLVHPMASMDFSVMPGLHLMDDTGSPSLRSRTVPTKLHSAHPLFS